MQKIDSVSVSFPLDLADSPTVYLSIPICPWGLHEYSGFKGVFFYALALMARGLYFAFCKAVDGLYGISGRIAVTGMGKSGHVARKVAATMASTGSPAYFIHPGEASHGDMGMLASGDAVLAFSNSGNTAELSDIVLYAARRNIPLIGVTRNADSLLGKHATQLLLLPLVPEADPLDCAPTTSTTLQMALGDALALTLMRRRVLPGGISPLASGRIAWAQAADGQGNHAHGQRHAPASGFRAYAGCAGADDRQGLRRGGYS